MCDVPDKPQDQEEDEDAEGEELDREMGDEASPDEQVVDEKMWDDSDDEDDVNKEEEKFEKDSGVQGEAIDGATRTKEEEDEGGNEKSDEHEEQKDSNPDQPQDEPQDEDNQETGEDVDGDINEDKDDRYEEQHGVDVKGDEGDPDEDSKADDQMQLDDDLNLDCGDEPDGAMDEEEDDNGGEPDQPEDEESAENALESTLEPEMEEDGEIDQAEDAAMPSGVADRMEADESGEPEPEDEPQEETSMNIENQQPSEQETHGIRASDGADGILDDGDENEEDPKQDETEGAGDTSGAQGAAQSQSESNGGGGFSERDGAVDEARESQQDESKEEIPNPFKNPGDASKFWHKKLNIVSNEDQEESNDEPQEQSENPDSSDVKGDFQYTSKEEESGPQVLGEATEEEAVELNQPEDEQATNQEADDNKIDENESKPSAETEKSSSRKQKRQPAAPKQQSERPEEQDNSDTEENPDSVPDEEMEDDVVSQGSDEGKEGDDEAVGNRVVSDLSRLKVEGQDSIMDIDGQMIEDEQVTGISSSEAAEARSHWLQIQGETFSLSRRLCEKLRLVMEPLVASKLRGDYRTGKRINMKRVIGYIASGYRKDKIWLRRTKPAKRDYRVLLAVDDSESMKKSGAGEMALRALSTLAVGMNQLEIGELGIASFGEDMKLLHPFHLPFTTESGADMVMNFKFDQKRTRTSLCVESAIAALDGMGGHSSMQLVFLVSDGRIERDSRDKLKRLIREMMERNILLAMIIVEGEHKKKDSIVHMKEVTFEKGKPVVKRFIEDYPFPYYIILDDMGGLPEVLGDALRQWFEMLTQLQSPR
jgi:midasin (ATPase involved in ribosome maturation)